MEHLFPQYDDGLTWISPGDDCGRWPCFGILGFDQDISTGTSLLKANPPPQATEDLKMMVCLFIMSWKVSRRTVLCIFSFLFFLKKIILHNSVHFIME